MAGDRLERSGHRERNRSGLPPHPDTHRCPHCCGQSLSRYGHTPRGAQRWHCHGCRRKHQATTRTPLAGLHHLAGFAALLADMRGPEPASCRALARRLALDKTTIWQWRQRACALFAATPRPPLAEPVASTATILRESRKASREWVNHARDPDHYPAPDRLRWADYRRRGLTPPDHLPRYRIPVTIATDPSNRPAASVGTSRAPEPEPPAPTPRPDRQRAQIRAERAATAFRRFLQPFRGPATRHLQAYTAWFTERAAHHEPGAAGR